MEYTRFQKEHSEQDASNQNLSGSGTSMDSLRKKNGD